MAFLNEEEILTAFIRLGKLAYSEGIHIELFALGGAVMVLRFQARLATKDIDAVILSPEPASHVRQLARQVAAERGWPKDWLNDGAKGFVGNQVKGNLLFQSPGITVTAPPSPQMLALKLSAWRDEVDFDDATVILRSMEGTSQEIWVQVEPFLVPGRETKSWYAFQEVYEVLYGIKD